MFQKSVRMFAEDANSPDMGNDWQPQCYICGVWGLLLVFIDLCFP